MSSGYVIASVTVTNPEQYEEYKKWSTLAMQAHGAEVCIRGGKVEVLEGDWNPGRTVLLKFPSFEAASPSMTRPSTRKPRLPAKAQPSCAWCASKASESTHQPCSLINSC